MASQIPDDEAVTSMPLRPLPNEPPPADQPAHADSQPGDPQKRSGNTREDAPSTIASANDEPDPLVNATVQPEASNGAQNVTTFGPADATAPDMEPSEAGEEPEEPKKKKKKSKSKKKAGGASGFEEYYVDPPVTPEEFERETKLYAANKPFTHRVQAAIQRYSAKRKFDPTRRTFWLRYLMFGGIQTGPKQFGGVDHHDLPDDATAEDIITLRATEYVAKDIVEDEQAKQEEEDHDPTYVVDFESVTRCFFSLTIQSHFDLSTPELVKTYCGVVRNWLNYLLHHNVCNEYKDDINAARNIVNQAEKELTALIDLPRLLPGTFSSACKAIYIDPSRYQNYQWGSLSTLDDLSKEDANRIFLAALAAMGSDQLCDVYSAQNEDGTTAIIETLDTGIEITGIHQPTKQVKDMYEHPSQHRLTPMGHITARSWYCPWAPQEDMTEEEEAALPAQHAASARDYTIWMDEDTLSKLAIGMKMTVDLHRLSFGLWFIENAKLLYPSYSMWIPNDFMEDWREHVLLPPKKHAERVQEFEKRQAEEKARTGMEILHAEDVEAFDDEDDRADGHGVGGSNGIGESNVVGEQNAPVVLNGDGHNNAQNA